MTLKYVFYYRMINKNHSIQQYFKNKIKKKRHVFTIECVTKLINIIVGTFFSFEKKKIGYVWSKKWKKKYERKI